MIAEFVMIKISVGDIDVQWLCHTDMWGTRLSMWMMLTVALWGRSIMWWCICLPILLTSLYILITNLSRSMMLLSIDRVCVDATPVLSIECKLWFRVFHATPHLAPLYFQYVGELFRFRLPQILLMTDVYSLQTLLIPF